MKTKVYAVYSNGTRHTLLGYVYDPSMPNIIARWGVDPGGYGQGYDIVELNIISFPKDYAPDMQMLKQDKEEYIRLTIVLEKQIQKLNNSI